MTHYWLSTNKLTFRVKVHNGKIVDSAPVGRWAIGKPFWRLERWLKCQGEYQKVALPNYDRALKPDESQLALF